MKYSSGEQPKASECPHNRIKRKSGNLCRRFQTGGITAATYSTNSLSGSGGKFFFGEDNPSDNTIDNQLGTVSITPSTGAVSGLRGCNILTGSVRVGLFLLTLFLFDGSFIACVYSPRKA
jgi:hypothetical protein